MRVQRGVGAGVKHLMCSKDAVTHRASTEKQECIPCAAQCGFVSISLELSFLLSCLRKTVSPSANTPQCLHGGEWSTSAFLTV